MSQNYEYQAFISYSSKDIKTVQEIAERLKGDGVKTWFDQTRMEGGTPIVSEIDKGASKSQKILVFLSTNSVSSPWVESELARFTTRDPSNKKRTVVPILLEECQVPEGIKPLHLIKWQQGNDESYQEILNACLKTEEFHNFLLIPTERKFTKALRDKLLSNSDVLGISEILDYKTFSEYEMNIYKFIVNSAAEWLYAVHPDDAAPGAFIDKFFNALKGKKKKLIFFESGFSFSKYQKEGFDILSINTEYCSATKQLIDYAIDHILSYIKNVHFITILGPENSFTANKRRSIYNEFLSRILLRHGLYSHPTMIPKITSSIKNINWNKLSELGKFDFIQISSLNVSGWGRETATEVLNKYYQSLDLDNPSIDNCFLCGNDDIVLGVIDCLKQRKNKLYNKKSNFSFFGFDGIDDLKNLFKREIKGATMEVQLDDICNNAVEIFKNPSIATVREIYSVIDVPPKLFALKK